MGDISLMQLKNSLQDIMMNPYPTSLGRDMRLLAQIGISTDARALGSLTLDKTRLRGYLEIDEPKLHRRHRPAPGGGEAAFRQRHHGQPCHRFRGGIPWTLSCGPTSSPAASIPSAPHDLDSRIAENNRSIDDYKVEAERLPGGTEEEIRPDAKLAGRPAEKLAVSAELQQAEPR